MGLLLGGQSLGPQEMCRYGDRPVFNFWDHDIEMSSMP